MSLERLVVEFDSDTRGLQRGLRDSKREMVGLKQVSGRLGLNRAFDTKQAQAQLRSLDKQMQRNAQQMQKYQKEADRLRSVIANPPKVDVAGLEAQYENTYRKLEAINNRIEVEQQKLSGLRERGTDPFGNFIGAERLVGEISRSELQIANLMVQSDKTNASLIRLENELSNVGGTSPAIEKAVSDLSALGDTMQQLELSNREVAAQYQSIERELEDVSRTSKKAAFGLRSIATEAKRSSKASAGPLSGITKILSQSIKRVVIMASAYKLVRSAASYLMDGLKTNKQFSDSLNTIKVNLAVAFQPIYDYVLPAINSFMQTLVKATTYIAVFINALFGKTYAESAAAAEELDNAKEAMEGYGSAASETLRQLAGFDKFNDITAQKSGGGAKSALSGLNFKDAFVDSDISDIFEKIKPSVDWLKEHLDEILEIAKAVGVAFLAWKLTSAFTNDIGKTLGVLVALGGLKFAWDAGRDIGREGFTLENLIKTALSSAATGIGAMLLLGPKIGYGTAFKLGASIAIALTSAKAVWDITERIKVEGWSWDSALELIGATLLGGLGAAGVISSFTKLSMGKALTFTLPLAFGLVAAKVFNDTMEKVKVEGWTVENIIAAVGAGLVEAFSIASFALSFKRKASPNGALNGEMPLDIGISKITSPIKEGIKATVTGISHAVGALKAALIAGFSNIAGLAVSAAPVAGALLAVTAIVAIGYVLFNKDIKAANNKIAKDGMSVDYDPGSSITEGFKEYFGGANALNAAQTAGTDVGKMFTTGMTSGVADGLQRVGMQGLAKQEAEKMSQGFKDGSMTAAELQALGMSIPDGVAKGIASGASLPTDAVVAMIKSGNVAAAQALDSHSSSKVYEAFGLSIDDGLAGGIEQGAYVVTDTLKGLFNSMISLTNSFVSRFTQGFNKSMSALVIAANTIDLTPGKASFSAAIVTPITKLATGGIAYGEVRALVGDNFNARQDPEVISPLSNLQQMITAAVLQRDIAGGGSSKVQVTLTLENGETLADLLIDPMNNTAKNLGYAPVFAPV